MKIRKDFVTNSSSSSYICIAKIDMGNELIDYIKEEFGRYGIKLLKKYARKGSDIKNSKYDQIKEYLEYQDMLYLLEDEAYYLDASFVVWSTEGDCDGDDAFLYSHIPDEYKEEIFRTEAG